MTTPTHHTEKVTFADICPEVIECEYSVFTYPRSMEVPEDRKIRLDSVTFEDGFDVARASDLARYVFARGWDIGIVWDEIATRCQEHEDSDIHPGFYRSHATAKCISKIYLIPSTVLGVGA